MDITPSHNLKEYLRPFVTVYETWIHWYTPEAKLLSKAVILLYGSTPKKATVWKSDGYHFGQ